MRWMVLIALLAAQVSAQLSGAASLGGKASMSAGSTAVPALPTTGLVAWWELINSAGGTGASGSTVTDLSGNGNTLTFTGAANPVNPTPSATGLLFSQAIASPVVGATLSIAANSPKTIIVVFNSGLSGFQGYMTSVNSIGQRASGVFLEYGGSFSVVPDIVSAANPRAASVPDGVWNFGAIRNSGSDALYSQNLNTNQVVVGTGPGTLTINVVKVGQGNTNFVGTIAEVLFYNVSLTDDQLAQAYANLKSRVAAVGIVI